MNTNILHQLTAFGVMLFISLLVWMHYRRSTFPVVERYSTFGPRFWTGFIDSTVLWPLGFITSVFLLLNIPRSLAALLVVAESVAWLIYTTVMHARYGQTIGKMVTKVRVVDFRSEGSISWLQAWLRDSIPMVLSLGLLGWEASLIINGTLTPDALVTGEALTARKSFGLCRCYPVYGLWRRC